MNREISAHRCNDIVKALELSKKIDADLKDENRIIAKALILLGSAAFITNYLKK